MQLDLGFDVIDGKHCPTIKITLDACNPDDNDSWKFRDKMGYNLYSIAQGREPEYVLYGYATPSGKLYASGMLAVANGEQSWVKVYVNKEDLK